MQTGTHLDDYMDYRRPLTEKKISGWHTATPVSQPNECLYTVCYQNIN